MVVWLLVRYLIFILRKVDYVKLVNFCSLLYFEIRSFRDVVFGRGFNDWNDCCGSVRVRVRIFRIYD